MKRHFLVLILFAGLGNSFSSAQYGIVDRIGQRRHLHYIHLNPAKKHLCISPVDYRYSSPSPGWKLDPISQGLTPSGPRLAVSGMAEAVPFQNREACIQTQAVLLSTAAFVRAEARPLQHSEFSVTGLESHITAEVER